ncbi:hypothetical protein GALMADRAFT_136128 [Galerina marginata CBS 339.88]|uniref:Uncharacterized protein n=1 Tax=Galerina marginata (strain CBS 339.88) TaxID=685588 RepID=A0A067TMD0_GALM3|nr:hypothetical protein GALMADRAFT_136128 [Galerina marginata CBS 339.88]
MLMLSSVGPKDGGEFGAAASVAMKGGVLALLKYLGELLLNLQEIPKLQAAISIAPIIPFLKRLRHDFGPFAGGMVSPDSNRVLVPSQESEVLWTDLYQTFEPSEPSATIIIEPHGQHFSYFTDKQATTFEPLRIDRAASRAALRHGVETPRA